ncbi:MAG: hypothetical protein RLY31_1741 [Bacteroidota bacterium]|jgi:L-fucose dehydrogenase
MDLGLEGKVFLVTGGSKGIGAGISRILLEEGALLLVATRSQDDLSVLGAQAPGRVVFHKGDLREDGYCRAAVEMAVAAFGRLDGLVNNAGVNDGVGLEAGPAAFRESLASNLHHYYDLLHFALPYLRVSKGSVVNISSKVAMTGQGGTSGYAAAKGAQLALTREWAAALSPDGIRVNAILPAEVMTPLYRRWLDTSFSDPVAQEAAITARIPLGRRMTTAEEIGAMAAYLLSWRAAHITGQWMVVDGGYVHLDRALT